MKLMLIGLGWLNVLQYHHPSQHSIPLHVNLVRCFEGMEESGCEGLDDLVRRESLKGGYFDGVECVCIVSHVDRSLR
jgi:Cys-Gly metallodipeptidase DUG1